MKKVYLPEWNFIGYDMRRHIHGIHDYPAMMMPNIIESILSNYASTKNIKVLDPYMGSGTTFVECDIFGVKEVVGFDLNPLALLIAKAKMADYNIDLLEIEIEKVSKYFSDKPQRTEVPNFSILHSWFFDEVIEELGKIKYYINNHISDEQTMNFFNVAFSHTIRASSQTRNGEFKLYRMTKKQLEKFDPDPIGIFLETLQRNFQKIKKYKLIRKNETIFKMFEDSSANLNKYPEYDNYFDFVITSPPYGDSHTTVAYGQFSRLMNEWLEMPEPNQVDRKLLGGIKIKETDYIFNIEVLDEKLALIKDRDKAFKNKRLPDVVSFYIDYYETIKSISHSVKENGYVIYVVGNRRVRNIELPTDEITVAMFKGYGFEHIKTIIRDIPNKRMPSKASPANAKGDQIPTMMNEYIVIMKKRGKTLE